MEQRPSLLYQSSENEHLETLPDRSTLTDTQGDEYNAIRKASPIILEDEMKDLRSPVAGTSEKLHSSFSVSPTTVNPDSLNCSTPSKTQTGGGCSSSSVSRSASPACLQTNPPLSNPTVVPPTHTAVRRPRHKPGERRELLTRAVQDVLNQNISMRRAAQKYNLAKSSLCDFVRKNKISLPNLRLRARTTGAEPNLSQSSARFVSSGAKRLSPEGDTDSALTLIPNKLPCGRKSSGVSLTDSTLSTIVSYGNTEHFENVPIPIAHSGHIDGTSINTNTLNSWHQDELGDSTINSGDGLYMRTRPLGYSVGTSMLGRSSVTVSSSKTSRIESPWHNAAGLPTQVPMRSWSAHGTFIQTANGSTHTSANTTDRGLPFNSLNHLRQAVEAQNLIAGHNLRTTAERAEFQQFVNTTSPSLKVPSFRQPDNLSCITHDSTATTCNNVIGARSNIELEPNFSGDVHAAGVVNGAHDQLDCYPTDLSDHHQVSNAVLDNQTAVSSRNDQNDKIVTSGTGEGSGSNTPSESGSLHFPIASNFSSVVNLPTGVLAHPNDPGVCSRTRDPRLTLSTHDITPSSESVHYGPATSKLSVASNNIPSMNTQAGLSSSGCATIHGTPYPALASILSADLASANQSALAALLFQQSRSFSSGCITTPTLPNLMGCPGQLPFHAGSSIQPSAQQLVSSDFPLSSTTGIFPSPTNPRLTTSRLSGSSPSVVSLPNLPSVAGSGLSVPDLSLQSNIEELQQFFQRQLQPKLINDLNTSPTVAALVSQLLLSQPNHLQNQPYRNLLTCLLGSLNSKVQYPISANLSSSIPQLAFAVASTGHNPILLNPETSCRQDLSNNQTQGMNGISSHARGLVDFINRSPSPFHAVQTACDILMNHGFRELKEGDSWNVKPTDCVFIRKNGSTLIAAAIGGKFTPGNAFHLLGAHTDSPCLRLKPVSERLKEGYVQLGVEAYGGGLWYTWFDRELKLAGRVVTTRPDGRLQEHLVHIDRPIACVPSLAIHLNQDVKTNGFNPNMEQHLAPILCTEVMDQVNITSNQMDPSNTSSTLLSSCEKRRHPAGLLHLISKQLGLSELPDVAELELYLSDFQPARVGGLHNEFIHAPRLDNLFNSYTSIRGLVDSLASLSDESSIRIVCLFDHEEIGSVSTQGANSQHTMNILRRLINALVSDKTMHPIGSEDITTTSTLFEESLSKSFLLSADQAHALHPSYHERHEPNHKPLMHRGVVLKYNSNQRYATNSLTATVVRQVARLADVPVQEFVVRQDMHCGSTIGPLLASQLGIATVDIGFPQLAMHSCRELCCTTSVDQAVRLYTVFYENLSKIWPPA